MDRSIDLAVQHIVVPKCVIEMMMHGLMIDRTTQVLIVHGTEDRLVDVEQSMSLAKVCLSSNSWDRKNLLDLI